MNRKFIEMIIELAKNGVLRSDIIRLSSEWHLRQKDAGKCIAEAKKQGMYSVSGMVQGDTYYQFS